MKWRELFGFRKPLGVQCAVIILTMQPDGGMKIQVGFSSPRADCPAHNIAADLSKWLGNLAEICNARAAAEAAEPERTAT